ncbi:MAG: hypothetical protein QNJ20_02965 [Paracoccaceae bacterium]|nr:hypothetical protein [Paracoccaceae bacterium]
MGRFFWISSAVVAGAIVFGLNFMAEREAVAQLDEPSHRSAFAEPAIGSPEELEIGNTGSALATAAFGLSALQPETFNSQIVRDIIEASPLAYSEKDRLTAKLMAAEAGNAQLPRVLADIRVSLALD